MAESKPSKFWGDASRKTATWTGVAALAAAAVDWLDDDGFGSGPEWEHWLAVIGAAAIRAIIALVQGKVGDPDKATFAPAATDDDGDGTGGG